MNSEWRAFLESAGAEFEEERISGFGNPEQERHVVSSGDIMCDLSHLAVLEVAGEESGDFLQNQFTNDIAALEPGESQLDGWCTPKGRLVALFQVVRTEGNRFLLLFPAELLESTQKRLQMFVMRSRVTITDLSAGVIRIGVSGPDSEKQLASINGTVPEEIDGAVTNGNTTIVRLHPALYPRFMVLTDLENGKKIWSHLDVQATPISNRPWQLLDIRAGIPSIVQETQESFIPQMVNLQTINGLSFTKGCYPGQEVVARMEYLGKLKRKMYRITLQQGALPQSGDPLYSSTSSSAQGAGEIVSIERDGDGVWEGLAVIETAIAESGDVTFGEDGSTAVTVQPL